MRITKAQAQAQAQAAQAAQALERAQEQAAQAAEQAALAPSSKEAAQAAEQAAEREQAAHIAHCEAQDRLAQAAQAAEQAAEQEQAEQAALEQELEKAALEREKAAYEARQAEQAELENMTYFLEQLRKASALSAEACAIRWSLIVSALTAFYARGELGKLNALAIAWEREAFWIATRKRLYQFLGGMRIERDADNQPDYIDDAELVFLRWNTSKRVFEYTANAQNRAHIRAHRYFWMKRGRYLVHMEQIEPRKEKKAAVYTLANFRAAYTRLEKTANWTGTREERETLRKALELLRPLFE